MDFESLKTYILDRLKSELNEDLMYHSPGHTKDVIKAVERYAELEGVNGHDKMLLKTAALFHDIGFTRVYKGHEDESIKIAREVLPGYGYSEKDIQAITGMINATKLPQNPTNHLEEIMADADLDYIGRDDLFMIGQKLQFEWKKVGIISSIREWHEKQLAFLKNHQYFTASARQLREEKKQENIRELEELICPKN
ncbi:MAG: HD domain-containing protein [Bacteroidales bacterium]